MYAATSNQSALPTYFSITYNMLNFGPSETVPRSMFLYPDSHDYLPISVTSKKSPNVQKSFPKCNKSPNLVTLLPMDIT